jgi:hypothetical protein
MKTIMQNNNPNNQHILQRKLDELDHLPGEEAISFDASWQKLELRMNPVRRRRRNYLYWIAAACLVAGFLLPWALNMQKPNLNEVVFNRLPITPSKPIKSNNLIDSNANNTRQDAMLVNTLKTTAKPPFKAPAVLEKQIVVIPENPVALKQSPEQEIIPAPVVDISAPVTAIVVKKPLGVVHLNDLNNADGSQLEKTAGNENKRMIRFIKRTGVETSLGDRPDERTSGNHILLKNIN